MSEYLEYLKSPSHLQGYLQGCNVKLEMWGRDGYKSVSELYKELKDGDCYLTIENGVIRCTSPLFIDVRYSHNGTTYQCYESRNKKGRSRNLPGTFAEKRLVGEDLDTSIARTFKEEINKSLPKSGISLSNYRLLPEREWIEEGDAKSYPNLRNRSLNTLLTLNLAPNQGIPRNFNLREWNGVTEFSWRTI